MAADEATPVRRPHWPLVAIALAWTALTPFLLGVVAVLIALVELAVGRDVVNHDPIAAAAIEALVYLVVSFGVFRMARAFGARSWFWLASPVGYLVGVVGYVLLGMAMGGPAELDTSVAVVVVDSLVCAVGAYVGTRPSAGRGDGGGLEEDPS